MPIPVEQAVRVITSLQAGRIQNLFAQAHARHVLHEVEPFAGVGLVKFIVGPGLHLDDVSLYVLDAVEGRPEVPPRAHEDAVGRVRHQVDRHGRVRAATAVVVGDGERAGLHASGRRLRGNLETGNAICGQAFRSN